MRDKALHQLLSGQSLTGKDGFFASLLKQFLESALEGEMSSHLSEQVSNPLCTLVLFFKNWRFSTSRIKDDAFMFY